MEPGCDAEQPRVILTTFGAGKGITRLKQVKARMSENSVRGRKPIFVVQKHQARTLHYDFRLEKDGVLKSWAVPKGVPTEKGVKRLAVEVKDHNLELGEFEGTIPEGEYGAGTVGIWDRGTYEVEEWLPDRIVFKLDGVCLKGRYCLVRFGQSGKRNWLLFRA